MHKRALVFVVLFFIPLHSYLGAFKGAKVLVSFHCSWLRLGDALPPCLYSINAVRLFMFFEQLWRIYTKNTHAAEDIQFYCVTVYGANNSMA